MPFGAFARICFAMPPTITPQAPADFAPPRAVEAPTPAQGQFVTFPGSPFQLYQPYPPAGDQPGAIDKLVEGFQAGLAHQTVLGVNELRLGCHRPTMPRRSQRWTTATIARAVPPVPISTAANLGCASHLARC